MENFPSFKKAYEKDKEKLNYETLLTDLLNENISSTVNICSNFLYDSWKESLENFIKFRGN